MVLKEGQVLFNGPTTQFVVQMDSQYTISYRSPVVVHGIQQKVVAQEALQRTLDELRSQNFEILEIRRAQVSLEQAFLKAAFGKVGPA